MKNYQKIFLKSPIPIAMIKSKNKRISIQEYNLAYKEEICEEYTEFLEKFLTTNMGNNNYQTVELNNNIYSIKIESIDAEYSIVWFIKEKQEVEDTNEYFQKTVSFDCIYDAYILVKNNNIIFMTDSYENILEKHFNLPCPLNEGFCDFVENSNIIEVSYSENNCLNFNKIINKIVEISVSGKSKYIWIRSNTTIEKSDVICIFLIDVTQKIRNLIWEKKDVNNFYSFISHEIKNPLSMILGTTQLIEKKVEEEIYEKPILRHIELIKQNCFRIMKIISNLSYKSKIESGYLDFNPSNQDIVLFIEDICKSVRDLVNVDNMKIIFKTDSENLIVGFDAGKIEKVILNLISNSLKYRNEDGGVILIELSHTKDYIYIKVTDNGIGIKEDDLGEIFNKYKRVKDNQTKAREGTGIGLSLVKSFAKLHNGDVEVDSNYGMWSEFTVKIANTLTQNDETNNGLNKEQQKQDIKVVFSDI